MIMQTKLRIKPKSSRSFECKTEISELPKPRRLQCFYLSCSLMNGSLHDF